MVVIGVSGLDKGRWMRDTTKKGEEEKKKRKKKQAEQKTKTYHNTTICGA